MSQRPLISQPTLAPPVGDGSFGRTKKKRRSWLPVIFFCCCCFLVCGGLLALAIGLLVSTGSDGSDVVVPPPPPPPVPTLAPTPAPPAVSTICPFLPEVSAGSEASQDFVSGCQASIGRCTAGICDVSARRSSDDTPETRVCLTPEAQQQCAENGEGFACTCTQFETCQRLLNIFDFVETIFCVDGSTPAPPPPLDPFAQMTLDLNALENELDGGAPQGFRPRGAARRKSQTAGGIPWSLFVANATAQAGATVVLMQSDFDEGTLRVRAPCKLVLGENIVFNPNPDHNWQPTDAQRRSGAYPWASGFALDFFAAITVESDNVLIELNNFELRQSREHTLQQAFAQLISLGNAPFVTGEGPAPFGEFFAPSNVVIRNGRLGANAHHAVHGNARRNIYIHDVQMESYRVASIAINGAERVMIRDCEALGTDVEVPNRGTYSQARFLVTHFLPLAIDVDANAARAHAALEPLLDQTLQDVVAQNEINQATHPRAYALFANVDRQQDGNTFGMRFTNRGEGTIQFDSTFNASATASNGRMVYVKNVAVTNTVNSVNEFVVLLDGNNNDREVRGPAGDVLGFDRMLRDNQLDELLDAQLAYALAYAKYGDGVWHVGPTHYVPQAILDWYEAGADIALFGQVVLQNNLHYMRNTDAMFHVNKGAHGIAIESTDRARFENVLVDTVRANGAAGQHALMPGEQPPLPNPATYTATTGGHVGQAPDVGYAGNRARGVTLGPSQAVDISGITVIGVSSRTGVARDYDVFAGANQLRNALPRGVTARKH